MADEKDKEEGEGETPPEAPKSNKKLIVIIGVAVLLLVAIGVPVTMMTLKGQDAAKKAAEELAADAAHKGGDGSVPEGHEEEDELEEGETALGALFPLETFVVNLEGGKYIRCQIQLEFDGRDVPKRFYARLVPARDSIITLLSSRSFEDVSGAQGKDALKKDVKDTINEILRKEDVKNVYFTQFVVQ